MTLYNVVKTIESVGLKQPNVNKVYEGSIYKINADPSTKYGNLIITQGQHEESDNTFTYRFIIFYTDRLVDDLESNRLQIQSHGMAVLSNILTTLENQYDFEFQQRRYNTFSERFKDLCAGAYVTVDITVYKDLICPELYD